MTHMIRLQTGQEFTPVVTASSQIQQAGPLVQLPKELLVFLARLLDFPSQMAFREVSRNFSQITNDVLREIHLSTSFKISQIAFCNQAARFGYLPLLQWESALQPPSLWNAEACENAAYGGHLEVLKWLRENGAPWNEAVCSSAAKRGHLEVLKWLRGNDAPWDVGVCSGAAYGGHLEVLKWLRENGASWNESACAEAAGEGHLEVLKWLREKDAP